MAKNIVKELEKQIVHTTTLFKKDENFNDERFMRCRIAAMHTNKNRNSSSFSREVVLAAKDTFANIPILAEVSEQLDENGNSYLDYTTHAMHIEQDAFGESEDDQRIIYDEKVVGIVPETNNFELVYDEETGNDYVYIDALLYRDYGNYVCDILESRGGQTDVSMEIACDDLSYSSKTKCLEVGKMTACGLTLLGANTQPGMAKAHATVFSMNNDTKQEQLIQIMQELKESLDNYTKSKFAQYNNGKEDAEVSHFEELLEKYGKTADDIEFEYENMTDEELDAKFAELFDEDGTDDGEEGADGNEPEATPNTEDENSDNTGSEPEDNGEPSAEEFVLKTFKLSQDDIRVALYNLIEPYNELDNDWYYISAIFDDNTFVMEGWNRNLYGQKFIKEDDNVALDGERYVLYREFVTESEKAELDSMRANYASIQEKAAKYDYDQLEKERMAEFSKEDYKSIADKKEFVELAKEENHKDFSLDEVKSKLNDIILSYAKAGSLTFSAEPTKKTTKVTRLPIGNSNKKKGRYGSLKFN